MGNDGKISDIVLIHKELLAQKARSHQHIIPDLKLDQLDQVFYTVVMSSINIYEAKTNFSNLITSVQKGKEIIISKSGKPVAKLIPYKKKSKPRKFGQLKGKIWISRDFDTLPADFMKYFS
jgi:prevent-host-death family protein